MNANKIIEKLNQENRQLRKLLANMQEANRGLRGQVLGMQNTNDFVALYVANLRNWPEAPREQLINLVEGDLAAIEAHMIEKNAKAAAEADAAARATQAAAPEQPETPVDTPPAPEESRLVVPA